MNKINDKTWEFYGKNNPYYGVSTYDIYDRSNLTEERINQFFITGENYIEAMFRKIHAHIKKDYIPTNCLDYGCGVGRSVIPLSKISKRVTGVDISDSMLIEANRICKARSIFNVEFLKADSKFFMQNERYDLIHSYIVFQHINTKRGEDIFRKLLDKLERDGVGVFHFVYNTDDNFIKKIVTTLRNYFPVIDYWIKYPVNIAKKKDISTPLMQMNIYNLNKILYLIQKEGADDIYIEFTNHPPFLGVIIYFKKH